MYKSPKTPQEQEREYEARNKECKIPGFKEEENHYYEKLKKKKGKKK